MMILFLLQLNPGRQKLSLPYDSTVGVGAGFYWFSACVLIFVILGVLRTYFDDKKWSGKTYRLDYKRDKKLVKKSTST